MSRQRVQRGVWREYVLKLLDFHTHRYFEQNGKNFNLSRIKEMIIRDADEFYLAERNLDKRINKQLDKEAVHARICAKFAEPEKWLIKECPPAGYMGIPIEDVKIGKTPIEEFEDMINE